MKLETRLTELNQLIKSTVGLNKADPDICIKLLDEYKCKFFFLKFLFLAGKLSPSSLQKTSIGIK